MAMSEAWEKPATLACAPYWGHCDYDDLLAVARLAAWKEPDHSYVAARSAVLEYLRGPLNRTRVRNKYGRSLPEAVPWEAEEVACTPGTEDPARQVIGRLWVEWLLGHPSLTATERLVIGLWILTDSTLAEISRRVDRSEKWGWEICRSARAKLKRVASGEYVPRSDRDRLPAQLKGER